MGKYKKIQYKGYDGYIWNNPTGFRCGYVKIPKSSIFFGKGYMEELPISPDVLKNEKQGKRGIMALFGYDGKKITMEILFDVHGSITYSADHLGEKTGGWFIGFDCGHAGDAYDVKIMDKKNKELHMKHSGLFPDGEIRTEEYVINEIKNLIDQIIKYENHNNNNLDNTTNNSNRQSSHNVG